MLLTLSTACPKEWSTRFVRWWWSCGHDLVEGGAVVGVRDGGGAAVAMAARFLCFGEDRGREKEWGSSRILWRLEGVVA
jgi:hypothetical protein